MSDSLAKYTFLPWMRQGLAAQHKETDHLGKDADSSTVLNAPTIDLNLTIEGREMEESTSNASREIATQKSIQLYGPGDIIGLENRAIVKTEPRHRVRSFEANFLPYVDFYEEDFPWRYTPLTANRERLRPWLALVVLKEDEFEREPVNPKLPLPVFEINGELDRIPFPPAYQLWAWAHVHVNDDLGEDARPALQNLLQRSPNLACSRIICPRKLVPETEYFAFLIPAFERGRLAGLGATSEIIDATDLQLAAWGHQQDHFEAFTAYQKRFPVYYQWSFKTAKAGDDFETLAKKIVPRELHPNVGKRLVDIQSPGYNLFYEGGEFPNGGAVLMEGALRHPDSNVPDLLNEQTNENEAFTKGLADLINLEKDLQENDSLDTGHTFNTNPYFNDDAESIYDDPIITPPLYGRYHALQNEVSPEKKDQWVDQLNLDPRNRIAAGLGVEVIRRNQETYMDRAWAQFAELFDLNDFLKKSQLTLEVNDRLFKKHLYSLHPAKLIALSASAHQVMRTSGKSSLKTELKNTPTPDGIFSSGFEKITRRGGRLVKRIKHYEAVTNVSSGTTMNMSAFRMSNIADAIARPILIAAIFDTTLRRLLHAAFNNLNQSNIVNWKWIVLNDNGLAGDYQAGNQNIDRFKNALAKITKQDLDKKHNYFNAKHWQLPRKGSPADFYGIGHKVRSKLHPSYSFHRKITNQYKNVYSPPGSQGDNTWLETIMKAPRFDDSTSEELIKISFDDFVPNLDLIPPNTSGLLEVNRRFVESFLVGLNYEMARELMWREFPTDQRGTYFKLFWDSTDHNKRATILQTQSERTDIEPIHTWLKDSKLGHHQQEGSVAEPLVLVIRGDLLNRYPYTSIYLEKAIVKDGERKLNGEREYPIFEAKIEPDIFFLGFNLTKEAVEEGHGYFFVIQERPGEVHFGLDSEHQPAPPTPINWDALNWQHLPEINHHIDIDRDIPPPPVEANGFHWGRGEAGNKENPALGEGSAADMACILYQKPVKMAIHASAMLPPKKEN